jgi:MFS family permease
MELSQNNEKRKYWILAAIFMAAKLCLHLFTFSGYELHRDELLYFNMGSHPAFGYLTVPPVTGWFAFLVKNIFGHSVFGIKLIPALFGAATLFIVAKTVRELGGGILALTIASVVYLLTPGFLLLFSLFTPNAIEYFLWSLAIYLIFRMTKTENPRMWVWIGIVLGLSFNTKYSVAFLIAGFFMAMLISKQRKLLFTWWFAAGIAVGLLMILPNIIWQYHHNWPVFNHFKELKETQISNLKYSHFFIDLFNLNSAFMLVWIIGLGTLLFSFSEKKYRFMGIAILITLLIFFGLKGKAYYVSGLLPFLVAFGGYAIEKYIKQRAAVIAGLSLLSLYSLLSLPFVLPILPFKTLDKYAGKTKSWVAAPFMRWEDGVEYPISQVFADMTGWQEIAGYVTLAFNSLDNDEKHRCTVYCKRSYGYAGAVHFYGKQSGLPEPVTFHESYIFWAPDSIAEEPIIYVSYNSNEFQPLFNEITEIGCVQDPYFREKGMKVFLCRNPKTNIQEVYRNAVLNERKPFTRDN